MKTLMKFRNVLLLITSMLLLTSCSSIMIVGDDTLQSIESIGDFFKVYFILQLSIYICSLIFTFIPLGGRTTSIIIHFIWVVSERDYGFFKVMLLFSLFTIGSFVINLIVNLIVNLIEIFKAKNKYKS